MSEGAVAPSGHACDVAPSDEATKLVGKLADLDVHPAVDLLALLIGLVAERPVGVKHSQTAKTRVPGKNSWRRIRSAASDASPPWVSYPE